MVAKGVATNDVRNFAQNQADAKKADKKVNGRILKCSMKSKLADTCALVRKLRYDKINLTKKLSYEMRQERWKCKRIMKSLNKEAKMRRVEWDAKNSRKMKVCSHKMRESQDHCQEALETAMRILKIVNVFKEEVVKPEDPAAPMVCDKTIPLSKDEK